MMCLEHLDNTRDESESEKNVPDLNKNQKIQSSSFSRLLHPPSSSIFFLSIQYWFFFLMFLLVKY
jgi:hypothetical protein